MVDGATAVGPYRPAPTTASRAAGVGGGDAANVGPVFGCSVTGIARTSGVEGSPRLQLRRRIAHGARLVLATARDHEALGGPGRWLVAGNLPVPAAERAPASPCPQDDGMHCHEQHRITAVVDGSGVLHTEAGDQSLRPGDVLVLAPGLRHRVSFHGGAPMQLLTVEFLPGPLLTADELPLVPAVFGGVPVIRCAAAAAAEAQRLMHRMRAEHRREKAAAVVAGRAYLISLLVLLYRRRGPGRLALPTAGLEPLLGDVQAYMETHFAEALRLPDLAAEAHLSVRQFTSRFKRAFGDSPMRYLTRLRVAAAQQLLCRSSCGVAEIAREVGYENLSHFYRTFLHHTGMSPGMYRRSPLQPAVRRK